MLGNILRAACMGSFALLAATPLARAADGTEILPQTTVLAAMARWEVPGLAVGVVRDKETLYLRSHGVGDVATGAAVTPDTLFAVGSIAKSFTVAGLDMLAQDGRVRWDVPVSTYLPDLRLRHLPGARAVTLRDLVTHRSGMHRHDALWYLHAYSASELIYRLRYLDPLAPPGAAFQYSNLMVAVAGSVAAVRSGLSWQQFTRHRLLAPLGMAGTRLSLAEFLATRDRAQGYFPGPDGRIPIPPRDTDAIGPAAAVYSGVTDMTRWLAYVIADMPRWSAVSGQALPDTPPHPEFGRETYRMGLYLGRYRGHPIARHPGVIDGFAALIAVLPRQRSGVVVLTNMSGGNPAPRVIVYSVLDRLLNLAPIDWLRRYPSAAERRAAALRAEAAPRVHSGGPPARPIDVFAGSYVHPAYGRLQFAADGTSLTGRFHRLNFRIDYVEKDMWRLAETHWPLRAGLVFRFLTDDRGRIRGVATPLADGPTYRHNPGEITFDRVGETP